MCSGPKPEAKAELPRQLRELFVDGGEGLLEHAPMVFGDGAGEVLGGSRARELERPAAFLSYALLRRQRRFAHAIARGFLLL